MRAKKVATITKTEKTQGSLKKILIISIIVILLLGGASALATNIGAKSVKIILSDGQEMSIITTKSKVGSILDDNHIITLENEEVTPSLEEEIGDDKTITISLKEGEKAEKTEESTVVTEMTSEEILESYHTIVEKLITEQIEIPFETITKDVSDGSGSTQNAVAQNGVNGLKEVVYKVKFKDGTEIERTVVSETVIREPVDKIVEVRTKQVTSRSYDSRATSGSVADYQAYAAQRCYDYGWNDNDVGALVSLWNRESGWNVYSSNRYSGAYGIPQALPGSKMAAYGSDYLYNYKTQIEWGLSYISGRYGSPSNAWDHFCSRGWY